MVRNNDISPIVEEIVIEEKTQQQVIQEILNKFKQPTPVNFVKLETKGRNYMCSTQGWKEPTCERFGFLVEDKWIQLDIPHSLMKKLELEEGKEISYPIHLNKEALEKELSFGGITLEEENEIFIEKPLTEKNLEKELERWLSEREKLEQDNKEKQQTIIELEKSLEEEGKEKKKIQGDLDELRKILNKLTKEKEIQTDLTAEQITQMEKDIEKHRDLLYQGAMEIERLEKELSEIGEEQTKREQIITTLQNQVKNLTPNEQEKRLLEYCNISGWIPNHYLYASHLQQIKKELTNWSNLRGDYSTIRNELVKVVDLLIRKVEIEQQKEQVRSELANKNQELTNLQTKYDMEVRSKEELIKYLSVYRRQRCIDLTEVGYIYEKDGVEKKTSKVSEELNRTFIEIIKQSTNYTYDFIVFEDGKLPFVFPKDKLAEQRLIIKTIYPSSKKIIEVEKGNRLWKSQPSPDLVHVSNWNRNYGTKDGDFYLDTISNNGIEIKVID